MKSNNIINRKVIVEMFLLLYYNSINIFKKYIKPTVSCKYEYFDMKMLFLDEKNQTLINDICYKTIKTKKEQSTVILIEIEGIDRKYSGDNVWLIWNELMNRGKTLSLDLNKWMKIQFDIFIQQYTKVTSIKRIQIILSVINVLYQENFKCETDIIIKRPFIEIMLKIDYIYQELGFLQRVNSNLMLKSICMLMFPNISSDEKVKKDMIPKPRENKEISLGKKKSIVERVVTKLN
jgi:hypothetical protein